MKILEILAAALIGIFTGIAVRLFSTWCTRQFYLWKWRREIRKTIEEIMKEREAENEDT